MRRSLTGRLCRLEWHIMSHKPVTAIERQRLDDYLSPYPDLKGWMADSLIKHSRNAIQSILNG